MYKNNSLVMGLFSGYYYLLIKLVYNSNVYAYLHGYYSYTKRYKVIKWVYHFSFWLSPYVCISFWRFPFAKTPTLHTYNSKYKTFISIFQIFVVLF